MPDERFRLSDGRRAALLAVVGLDVDPFAVRLALASPAPGGPEADRARRREIRSDLARFRGRESWSSVADVGARIGPEALEDLRAARPELVEEWDPGDGPAIVPTPLGKALLGVELAERSRATWTEDPGGDGESIQVIEDTDYWDFRGPAAAASPRVPTRRGVYSLEADDVAEPAEEPGPAEELVELVVCGQVLRLPADSPLARLASPAAGPSSGPAEAARIARLLGGLATKEPRGRKVG